jgi:hypothetical protein
MNGLRHAEEGGSSAAAACPSRDLNSKAGGDRANCHLANAALFRERGSCDHANRGAWTWSGR